VAKFLLKSLSLWITSKADREDAPQLQSAENANIQPNPRLILRAEPTVTNILKVSPFLLQCWGGRSPPQSWLPEALGSPGSQEMPSPTLC